MKGSIFEDKRRWTRDTGDRLRNRDGRSKSGFEHIQGLGRNSWGDARCADDVPGMGPLK
jgi:hypothetical protein